MSITTNFSNYKRRYMSQYKSVKEPMHGAVQALHFNLFYYYRLVLLQPSAQPINFLLKIWTNHMASQSVSQQESAEDQNWMRHFAASTVIRQDGPFALSLLAGVFSVLSPKSCSATQKISISVRTRPGIVRTKLNFVRQEMTTVGSRQVSLFIVFVQTGQFALITVLLLLAASRAVGAQLAKLAEQLLCTAQPAMFKFAEKWRQTFLCDSGVDCHHNIEIRKFGQCTYGFCIVSKRLRERLVSMLRCSSRLRKTREFIALYKQRRGERPMHAPITKPTSGQLVLSHLPAGNGRFQARHPRLF